MTKPGAAGEGWQLQESGAEAYERYLASAFAPWARELVARAGIREGERVLDVACGTGIVARQASEAVGPGGRVAGVDFNEEMLRVARSMSPDIEWRRGNAGELPFPDASFDAVLCEQGMQFFSDPAKAASEMRRVLVPDGRAAASICRSTAYCTVYEVVASALARHVSAEAAAVMRSPFPDWEVETVRGFFTEAGFRSVQVTIEVASLRYPSVLELVRREAASSPLAGPMGALPERVRRDLIADLEVALRDHRDDGGVVCPIESYVAVAA